jgi:putative membrane protein
MEVMFSFALLLHTGSANWNTWKVYPSFLVGWLIFGGVYFLFAGPLRKYLPDSREVPPKKIASMVVALVLMFLSLQGPLHELSDIYLFSAHMVQHLAIMLLMPPFLLYGIPGWMLRPVLRIPGTTAFARWSTHPIIAFALINVIFGAWHFPGPYDLMMRDHDVHIIMHLMIMATGVIMWWPVMSPLPELPRIVAPMQMVYLFVLGIPMMVVAALITFSPEPIYTWYGQAPRVFGLDLLSDQRLGGVIMWVPGALVLWIGISVVYFRWTQPEVRADEDAAAKPKAAGGISISPPPYHQP